MSPSIPPVAPRESKDVSVHGDTRIDDYHWLRDRDDPRTLPYLRAENAHAEAWFAPHAALKEQLYQEMLGRVQQDDESVPYRKGAWWYSTRTLQGEQYPRHVRRAAAGADRHYDAAAPEEVLLDLNAMAAGKAFLRLGAAGVSPDGQRLAYTLDETGGLDYTLHVKTLATGAVLAWSVEQVDSVVWSADNRTLYYVTMDEAKRADKLWRHRLGDEAVDASADATADKSADDTADELLFEEPDELYSLDVSKTRDERYVLVGSGSKDSNEVRFIDTASADAALQLVFARRDDIEYGIEHRGGRWFALINDTGRNFRLVAFDVAAHDLADAQELIAARDDVMLDDVDVFADHLVVTERAAGNLQLRVMDLDAAGAVAAEHTIAFDEPAYDVGAGQNAEFETHTLRFVYASLTTPPSTWDYDLRSRERVLRKRQPVPGYDPALYASERLMATATDGVQVPISLVYRRDLKRDAPQPLLLYGYGSYGLPTDPWFSGARVSLLDRGLIFAIAHIRGGGDLGRSWYEAGKMGRKMTSFTDFIACADALVARGYTEPAKLAIEGGSAGGLLMAAVTNLRPELFKAVLAEVPFVDVITTMLDESLPLTVGEFIEWGNPKEPEQYAWMRAYSPYDNLKPGAYPAMLVRTGLNDSQVAYWEPSKYVAKLRTLKTDDAPLLLKINLEVGHGGSSGRFDALKEVAEDDVFLLQQLGWVD